MCEFFIEPPPDTQRTERHGDYMFEIQHINKEENVLISGTREKSAVGDSAEPKQ